MGKGGEVEDENWVVKGMWLGFGLGILLGVTLMQVTREESFLSGLDKRSREIPDRVLVIYAYSEIADKKQDIRKNNLQFFIDFAINGKHQSSDVDYVIVINGYTCTVDIPEYENTYVIVRENTGFDACAWKEALLQMKKLKGEYWYKFFVLLNASVRGPFIPPYANDKHWITYFTKYLNNETRLVGTSICCSKIYPVHIQSMFLVTSISGLQILEEDVLRCYEDKQSVIDNIEIKMSQVLLKRGFNIASLLKQWEDHDFRDKKNTEEICHKYNKKMNGDPYYPNVYYNGIDISPFEVIFFKNNRAVNQKTHDAYTQMMLEWKQKYSSKKSTGYIAKDSRNYIHL
ncbi:unnamed protein product [Owenia fusiformis]|uniref:Uncharacterized protein n=1 Tax=Owenia fusiformis TaxID=6347 RepID=A0A8S4PWG5_OWEFU|nr:unnamed protein product [Owenia fusiformis]